MFKFGRLEKWTRAEWWIDKELEKRCNKLAFVSITRYFFCKRFFSLFFLSLSLFLLFYLLLLFFLWLSIEFPIAFHFLFYLPSIKAFLFVLLARRMHRSHSSIFFVFSLVFALEEKQFFVLFFFRASFKHYFGIFLLFFHFSYLAMARLLLNSHLFSKQMCVLFHDWWLPSSSLPRKRCCYYCCLQYFHVDVSVVTSYSFACQILTDTK